MRATVAPSTSGGEGREPRSVAPARAPRYRLPMPTPRRPSRFRLPSDVRPVEYDLHLRPDLEAGRFDGEVTIRVRLERPRTSITLHAAELGVTRAVVRAD